MDLPKTIPGLVLLVLVLAPIAVSWWPWWLSFLLAIAAGAAWMVARDSL